MSRDLSKFTEDNAHWRSERKRVPWEKRMDLIDEEFPSVRNADWNVLLRDNDIFARLLKDILKVDQMEPNRAGPRPNLDYDRGMQTWREMTGKDYCDLPFPAAFRTLAHGQSFSAIAHKTTISRPRVYRLWHGQIPPNVHDLRHIAEAYKKKPAYFAEYRAEYIVAAIAVRLAQEAEMTVGIYTNLVRADR